MVHYKIDLVTREGICTNIQLALDILYGSPLFAKQRGSSPSIGELLRHRRNGRKVSDGKRRTDADGQLTDGRVKCPFLDCRNVKEGESEEIVPVYILCSRRYVQMLCHIPELLNSICSVYLFQPESRLDFDLLRTSRDGDSFQVRRVLDSGRVHVDCMDEEVIS